MNAPLPSHPFAVFKVNDPAAIGLPEVHRGDVVVTIQSPGMFDGERVTILTDLGTARLLESAVFEVGMDDVPLNAGTIKAIALGWPADWHEGAVEWADWRIEEVHRG